jgi:hypothetical protein
MDELSDTKIRNATPADQEYAIADGQGLSVVVRPNGTKLWLTATVSAAGAKICRLAPFPASGSRLRAKSATISHRLMPLVGHPDRGEFPGAQ